VSLELAMSIFRQELEQIPVTQGVIFDGTPRRIEEVDFWDQALPGLGRAFTHLFALTLPKSATIERLSKRRICSNDGTSFIFGVDIFDDATPCPKCGGKIIWRTDDTPAVIEQRLKLYDERTAPVIESYRSRGIVHEIDGEQSIPDVFRDIEKALRT
jgi:adenylate kinase